jgi:hypothetical protein
MRLDPESRFVCKLPYIVRVPVSLASRRIRVRAGAEDK